MEIIDYNISQQNSGEEWEIRNIKFLAGPCRTGQCFVLFNGDLTDLKQQPSCIVTDTVNSACQRLVLKKTGVLNSSEADARN